MFLFPQTRCWQVFLADFRLLPVVAMLLCCSGVMGADPFPGTLPGVEIGSGLPPGFEPSGAAWNPVSQRLLLCGDSGVVASINPDGSGATHWTVAGDLEGIAVADPATSLVYVLDEGLGRILEVLLTNGSVLRTFTLASAELAPAVGALTTADLDALEGASDNDGPEALTFVPDQDGGAFFVGSQENGTIYRFRLSLASGTTVTYLGKFKTWTASHNDLSGLDYDSVTGRLLAIWDNQNILRLMTPQGVILREWNLPPAGNDEEGVAFDGTHLYIAEDPAPASEVWRYAGFAPAMPVSLREFVVDER
jgi:hypothetical protein